MPTSDNDKTSAVNKVVEAFRARRAGHGVPDAEETAAQGPHTPIVKIEPGQALGGGDSATPTKSFTVPTDHLDTDEIAKDTGAESDTDEIIADANTDEIAPEPDTDQIALDADTDEIAPEPDTDEIAVDADTDAALPDDDAVAAESAAGDTADGAAEESAEDGQSAALDEAAEHTDAEVEADDAEVELAVDSPDGRELADSEVAADDLAAEQSEEDETEAAEGEAAEAENEGEAAEDEDTPVVEQAAAAIAHQTVVQVEGSGERADVRPRAADTSVHPDEIERAGIVEQSVTLVQESAEDVDDSSADATPTRRLTLPVAQAAQEAPTTTIDSREGATEAAAPASAQDGEWSSTAHTPEVIPPGPTTEAGKNRRIRWAVIAAAVVLVIAALLWFFLFYSSPQSQAAKAAERYQNAMSEGDLTALQNITCGADRDFYASVSPEEFAQAYQSQIARNQMMAFKDVTGVAIDGSTARVGVNVYNTSTPEETIPAQVTLHEIDGEWKVCAQP